MEMLYWNQERSFDDLSTITNEESELKLASDHPKKRSGRKKFKETRHPVYRGVCRRNSKWVCEVREPKKKNRIWLGSFPTAEMAARAHDVATIALRGKQGACLNFADSTWRLPIPASSDTKDIQKAATEAAEAFRPAEDVGSASSDTKDIQKAAAEAFRPAVGSTTPQLEDVDRASPKPKIEEDVFYMDDEVVFGMPGLLTDMYEGLGMMPPCSWSDNDYYDEMALEAAQVSLWSYSF